MKLKSTTLILVVTALVLGGVAYFLEARDAPEEVEVEQQQIFAFEESQVQSLRLETQLRSLVFERDDEGWQMLEPERMPASEASIAYLLNLLVTERSDRTLEIPNSDREQFSFHQPLATIDVELDNQETHRLILGGYDFNRSFIYAQADPPTETPEELKVLLVTPNFENAVSRPLSEWQAEESEEADPGADADDSPTESDQP